ncbi:DUF1127 domain-containing protein [Vibrio sinaloensis]|uniref:DUF1127 domain-containing protein n=1 Tax=Photobacterium sp. (strain ATCC 43367) TaxID=379097 RepID=UPI0032B7DF42
MENTYINEFGKQSVFRSLLKKFLTNAKVWKRNYTTRRELSHLSEHSLRDIGVTREEAYRESIRYYWDT